MSVSQTGLTLSITRLFCLFTLIGYYITGWSWYISGSFNKIEIMVSNIYESFINKTHYLCKTCTFKKKTNKKTNKPNSCSCRICIRVDISLWSYLLVFGDRVSSTKSGVFCLMHIGFQSSVMATRCMKVPNLQDIFI